MNSKEVPWTLKDVAKALWMLIPVLLLFLALRLATRRFLTLWANPFSVALGIIFFYSALVAVAWFFGPRSYRERISSLGLKAFSWPKGLLIAIGWLIILRIFIVAYGILLELGFGFEPSTGTVDWIPRLFGQEFWGLLAAAFLVAVVAPIGEEIFFRGFIYPALRKRWGAGLAMVLSACIFTLFHLHWWLFVPVFSIGVALAYLYERYGSLTPSILLHSFNNLLSIVGVYYFLR